MNAPKGTFVPKLWADSILKMMRNKSVFIDMFDTPHNVWEVWFAWFPVKIGVITRQEVIHDELIVEGHTRWRWLTTVSRRLNGSAPRSWRAHLSKIWWPELWYEYGPATNALTQPKPLLGRNFWNGK